MVLAAYEYNLLCNPFAATVSNRDDISAITRDDSKAAIYLGPRATSASLSPSHCPCILGAYEYGLHVATGYGTSSPSIHLSTTTATRPGTMANPPESQPLELNEAPIYSGFWSTAYDCDVSLCLHLATSAQLLRAESKTSGDRCIWALWGEQINRVSREGSAARGRGRIYGRVEALEELAICGTTDEE